MPCVHPMARDCLGPPLPTHAQTEVSATRADGDVLVQSPVTAMIHGFLDGVQAGKCVARHLLQR
jgi:hypothetical protein